MRPLNYTILGPGPIHVESSENEFVYLEQDESDLVELTKAQAEELMTVLDLILSNDNECDAEEESEDPLAYTVDELEQESGE